MLARRVLSGELARVQEILRHNAQWMTARGIDQWPLDWLLEIAEEIEAGVQAGRFWCYDLQGQIAALAEVREVPEALWSWDDTAAVYVHKLAVDRRLAPAGLGRQLLDALIARSREAGWGCVRLDCVADNKRLCNFYLRAGFAYKGEVVSQGRAFALFELRL